MHDEHACTCTLAHSELQNSPNPPRLPPPPGQRHSSACCARTRCFRRSTLLLAHISCTNPSALHLTPCHAVQKSVPSFQFRVVPMGSKAAFSSSKASVWPCLVGAAAAGHNGDTHTQTEGGGAGVVGMVVWRVGQRRPHVAAATRTLKPKEGGAGASQHWAQCGAEGRVGQFWVGGGLGLCVESGPTSSCLLC